MTTVDSVKTFLQTKNIFTKTKPKKPKIDILDDVSDDDVDDINDLVNGIL